PAHHPPPAPRLPRRRLPRHRRGPAAQPGQERHRRVTAERRGVLQVAGAALLWSLGGIGIKAVAEPPLKIAAYRSATAAAVLFLLFRPKLGGRGPGFFAATACCAACLTTFVVATKWTTAANAVFLQYSGVVWVFLLAPLVVGEPRHARDALAIAAAQALFLRGLEHVRAAQAALVSMLEPIANPPWVLLVLGEVPSVFAVVGGAVVLAAIPWRTLGAPAAAPAIGALD